MTTVVDQTSMYGKLVNWVNLAWSDIQLLRPDWLFMQSEFSFDTTAGQRDYTQATAGLSDLSAWNKRSFLIYEKSLSATDQNPLPYLQYSKWRDAYRSRMTARPNDRPQLFTILTNNSLRFEAQPDKIYTVDGEYRRTAQALAANTDTPTGLPDEYHMLIVWKALMYYADDQNAPELLDKAEEGYDPLLHRLEITQLPEFDTSIEALA